ncbi:3-oxoacyl-[acyl-carrier protein] reductase [Streptomyces sp. TLI_55]|uniref:SDR family NAD(P)-dependent oxidoreductase n=1 Tax=Streptomyces sp. TLI_55 TaxID=1938861 RepID=UPI000BC37794|nr:SDR family NAD(P)-dependent oxidoreductase [Streptomyces sp. TLI_55]SNX62322.1 3-oxoacyl-[acyl-carrier protein] reductase [Streptomyces sp. TLI_55]
MRLLEGQVALVTGAGGGIGRGIALRFAERGAAAVAVHCRTSVAAAEEVAARVRESGARAVVLRADLRDEGECRRLVREAAEWGGGRLDALVNNAGVQPVQALPGMTAEEWREVVDANLSSVFACTQAAAEVMGGGGSAMEGDGSATGGGGSATGGGGSAMDVGASVMGRGGSVTHIASIEAHTPAAGHAHYSAAKAAVVMHARSAALEYGPRGIRVNSVSPGLIDRDGLAEAWPEGVRRWQQAAPLGRLGRPEDIGDACAFLASPLASWITGQDLVVDGGVSARPTW